MEVHVVNGREYMLACLDRQAPIGAAPLFVDSFELIPKADWKPSDLRHLVSLAWSQGLHGACVSFGCEKADDTLRRAGHQVEIKRSPWDLYRRINGGHDAGANIHDALTVMRDEGVCNLELCPQFTLDQTRTAAQAANASLHKLLEFSDCPDRVSIATALQRGFPVPFGVTVTTSWTPDSDGWIWPRGSSRGGHCVMGFGFAFHVVKKVWGIPFCNSWDTDWGVNGWGIYPLDLVDDNYADAWAARVVTLVNE
jgi:hypothetical protein